MNSDLSNLLSGLIGGLIGSAATLVAGYIGYLAVFESTNKQIKAIINQDQKRRIFDKEKEGRLMVEALVAETKQNIKISEKRRISHAKVKFVVESWGTYKGSLDYLDPEGQELVLTLYAQINSYNNLVEYEKERIPYGHGYMDDAIEKQAIEVIEILPKVLNWLEGAFRAVEEDESQGLTFIKPN